jgi:hypothetical protein
VSFFHYLTISGALFIGILAASAIYRSPSQAKRRAERKRREAHFAANWRRIMDSPEVAALEEN